MLNLLVFLNNTSLYLIINLIILALIGFIIARHFYLTKSIENVCEALKANLSKQPEKFTVTKSTNKYSELICESNKNIYFVKIIHNMSCGEICVNNSVRWQVRKNKNDSSNTYLKNVMQLMKHDFTEDELKNKVPKKIFVVYKDSRSLLMYINESEMVFIKPETNVHGTTVITYKSLLTDPDVELTNYKKSY